MTALEELSILIVTWNGDNFLQNCLKSLKFTCGDKPQIIVVDNANSIATQRLANSFPNCQYISSPQNLGFAGGNNLGVNYCSRKYVALLNNDTIIKKEPFTQLISELKEHPDVGIVQGILRLPSMNGALDTCGTLMTSIGKLHLCHFLEHLQDSELRPMDVFSAKGALMLFEKDLIKSTGGFLFHGHFFNNYEETDFCHRTWLSGKKVRFIPTPAIDHLYNATINRLPPLNVKAQGLANMLFSFHSLFGAYGRLRLLPFFYFYQMLMIIRDGLTGSTTSLRVFIHGFRIFLRHKKELFTARKFFQTNRAISDRELLYLITYHPPKGYWTRIIKTWLKGNY